MLPSIEKYTQRTTESWFDVGASILENPQMFPTSIRPVGRSAVTIARTGSRSLDVRFIDLLGEISRHNSLAVHCAARLPGVPVGKGPEAGTIWPPGQLQTDRGWLQVTPSPLGPRHDGLAARIRTARKRQITAVCSRCGAVRRYAGATQKTNARPHRGMPALASGRLGAHIAAPNCSAWTRDLAGHQESDDAKRRPRECCRENQNKMVCHGSRLRQRSLTDSQR
jgi:hypothetical protein